MNILISVNIDYYTAAIIMLRSLFYNNKNCHIKIYMLHAELGTKRIQVIRSLIEKNNGELYVIRVNDDVLKDVPVGVISKETYYRLMAPELLPTDLDKVLYLDIDMIITGSIREIYQADFQNNLFMAVPDTSAGVDEMKKMHGMGRDSIYINAGVLLMNLELLRKEFDLKKALGYAIRYPERVPCCDQDVINALYYKRIGHFDGINNYEARFHSITEIIIYPFRSKYLLKRLKIIHYMGQKKPWKPGFEGKFLREYYRYARNTSYEKKVYENMQKYFGNLMKLIGQMIKKNALFFLNL